eukprot:s2760_g18.t1
MAVSQKVIEDVQATIGFLSLSSSHTVAFLRAMEAGLAGPDGHQAEVSRTDASWQCIDQGLDLAQAIQRAKEGDIRSQASLPDVATYVQKFAGGPKFPLVFFLAKFAKAYGQALMVGQEFMATMATMDFRTPGQEFPFIRMATWATMVTGSHKSSDGFAKILSKSDLDKLRGHATIAKTKEAEQVLLDAWKTMERCIQQASDNGQANQEGHYQKAFGKLAIRTILFLCQKQKNSREPNKTWNSIQEILQQFATDCQTREARGNAATSSTEPEAKEVKDLLTATPQTMALLQNSHLKIGYVYCNQKEHDQKVFIFTSIDDTHATMVHQPILEPELTVKVPHEDLKLWKATKAKMPKMADASYVQAALPQTHSMVQMEYQRLQVGMALHKAMEANKLTESQMAFTINPTGLYTRVKFAKKHQLKLVPLGNIVHIKGEKVTNSMTVVQAFGHHWQIQSWKQDSTFDNPDYPLVPFWWCKKTREEEDANLSMSSLTIDTIKIPILTNESAIEKDQQLFYLMATSEEPSASVAKAKAKGQAKRRKIA